jgi:hypothetical protein
MKKETLNKRVQKYESLFVKESDLTAREGKSVYVRQEFHNRISRIVQVSGQNRVSIFSYIDNVLDNHLKNYRDEISESYEQNKVIDIF